MFPSTQDIFFISMSSIVISVNNYYLIEIRKSSFHQFILANDALNTS